MTNFKELYIRIQGGTWMRFTGTEKHLKQCSRKAAFLNPTSINFVKSVEVMIRMYGHHNFDESKVIKID